MPEEEFHVEKSNNPELQNQQSGKVIDEANYRIRAPRQNGPAAVGRGGDPLFRNIRATKEQLIEKLVNFKGVPQELELPSAPKQFIQYLEEDNRPQVALDVDYEKGMGVSVGRLREDTVYDWKFVGLSHNTVRGAAGGAILCAETLKAKGYIQAK